jgi:phosphoribosylanthranilate isomerase
MRPKVKICGLQKPVDAQYVNDAGADYAGFVFYEKSKRNVSCQKAQSHSLVPVPFQKEYLW